jgi:hypothetical protein
MLATKLNTVQILSLLNPSNRTGRGALFSNLIGEKSEIQGGGHLFQVTQGISECTRIPGLVKYWSLYFQFIIFFKKIKVKLPFSEVHSSYVQFDGFDKYTHSHFPGPASFLPPPHKSSHSRPGLPAFELCRTELQCVPHFFRLTSHLWYVLVPTVSLAHWLSFLSSISFLESLFLHSSTDRHLDGFQFGLLWIFFYTSLWGLFSDLSVHALGCVVEACVIS